MYSLAKAEPPKSCGFVSCKLYLRFEVGDAYSERARSVASGGPAGTPVQAHSLILDDLEKTTATESLRVCLSLDLKNVKRKKDDLSDTNQTKILVSCELPLRPSTLVPSSSGVHDGLAGSPTESIVEIRAPSLGQKVASERLSSVFINPLQDLATSSSLVKRPPSIPRFTSYLVSSSVSETREEGGEFASDGGISVFFEYDLVEHGGRGNLNNRKHLSNCKGQSPMAYFSLVGHQSLSSGIDLDVPKSAMAQIKTRMLQRALPYRVEDHEFRNSSTP